MADSVVIDCPMPPSVNRIWRRRKDRVKPYLDTRYASWKRVFDNIIMATRPRPRVPGHFIASITLDASKRKGDADNRAKAVLDALQHCEIIENDKLADSVTIRWGYAPEGCRIVLTPSPRDPVAVPAPVAPRQTAEAA